LHALHLTPGKTFIRKNPIVCCLMGYQSPGQALGLSFEQGGLGIAGMSDSDEALLMG
jgi:hypothetical protein